MASQNEEMDGGEDLTWIVFLAGAPCPSPSPHTQVPVPACLLHMELGLKAAARSSPSHGKVSR